MISKKGVCSACGEDRYIVNRKHMCCNQCNTIRINGADRIAEKKQKYKKSLQSVSNSSKIKQKSKSLSIRDRNYDKVKAELIQDAIDDETYVCKGCGNPNSLSLSHLVRRSRSSDLADVKENMTFHCLVRQDGSEGCHQRWESYLEMYWLDDFDDNMKIIRRIEPEYYWLVVGKLRELGFEIDVNSHKEY